MAFEVPMIEVAVTVAMSGQQPEEYFLYLAPFSERREGPETVADYLNGQRRFFPMNINGAVRMLSRDQMLWVRYEKLADVIDYETTIIEKVTLLEMVDGSKIEGMIPIDRPRDQSRVSDVLNDPREIFFRIDVDAETYYVNKTFVRTVIPK